MSVFDLFFDAEDLSACVDAQMSVAQLNAQAAEAGAYFPLWLDLDQTLGDLFLNVRAASRSFRYGLIGDNVLGLRWNLPNGRSVDLGGRVVKNVAGFELIRFLSASQGRLGRPERLIVRLRPKAQAESLLKVEGPFKALGAMARLVRGSSWAHAIDAMDLRAGKESAAIYLSFRARQDLLALFESQVQAWAKSLALTESRVQAWPSASAAPLARVQAPQDTCLEIAAEWIQAQGGEVHGFLGQGLLQLETASSQGTAFEQGLQALSVKAGALGGQVEHPSLAPDPAAPQARWEQALLAKWEAL